MGAKRFTESQIREAVEECRNAGTHSSHSEVVKALLAKHKPRFDLRDINEALREAVNYDYTVDDLLNEITKDKPSASLRFWTKASELSFLPVRTVGGRIASFLRLQNFDSNATSFVGGQILQAAVVIALAYLTKESTIKNPLTATNFVIIVLVGTLLAFLWSLTSSLRKLLRLSGLHGISDLKIREGRTTMRRDELRQGVKNWLFFGATGANVIGQRQVEKYHDPERHSRTTVTLYSLHSFASGAIYQLSRLQKRSMNQALEMIEEGYTCAKRLRYSSGNDAANQDQHSYANSTNVETAPLLHAPFFRIVICDDKMYVRGYTAQDTPDEPHLIIEKEQSRISNTFLYDMFRNYAQHEVNQSIYERMMIGSLLILSRNPGTPFSLDEHKNVLSKINLKLPDSVGTAEESGLKIQYDQVHRFVSMYRNNVMPLPCPVLLIILDGAPEGLWETDMLTPLHRAGLAFPDHPKCGGLMHVLEGGNVPESHTGVLEILGNKVDPETFRRGPIEAIGVGLEVEPGALALRVNLAFLEEGGRLPEKPFPGKVPSAIGQSICLLLQDYVNKSQEQFTVSLKHVRGHRAAAVIACREGKSLSSDITNTDPRYPTESTVVEQGPFVRATSEPLHSASTEESVRGSEYVNRFSALVEEAFQSDPTLSSLCDNNHIRVNSVLTRGAGADLPTIRQIRDDLGDSEVIMIAESHIEVGLAKLVGATLKKVSPDDDPKVKRQQVLTHFEDAINERHSVIVHLKGPDDYGHQGDLAGKTTCLTDIYNDILVPLVERASGSHTIVVTSDHATSCQSKRHTADSVPFVVMGQGVVEGNVAQLSEEACKTGIYLSKGRDLMGLVKCFRGAG